MVMATSKIENKYALVSSETQIPENSSVYVSYPPGFSESNSVVVSYWSVIDGGKFNGNNQAQAFLLPSNIRLDNKGTGGRIVKAMLFRYQ